MTNGTVRLCIGCTFLRSTLLLQRWYYLWLFQIFESIIFSLCSHRFSFAIYLNWRWLSWRGHAFFLLLTLCLSSCGNVVNVVGSRSCRCSRYRMWASENRKSEQIDTCMAVCVCVCVCHMRFVRRYNNHWKRLQLRSDVIEKMLWFSLLPSIELNAVLLILLIHNHKLSPGSETVSIRYVWRAERNSYGFHIYGLLISTNNDDTYCVFRNATHQLNILNSGNIGLQQQSKEKGTPMRTPHGSAFFSLAFVYAMNSKFI